MRRRILFVMPLILLLAVVVSKLFVYDTGPYSPLTFSTYANTGYYEIDPNSILYRLNLGKFDVLAPGSEDMFNRETPYYPVIRWSQADYLKIVDAVSRETWHEPLNLKEWSILSMYLEQDCSDNPAGFASFDIVYFQDSSLGLWHRTYSMRLVEIISWQGLIRWGDDTYSDVILPGWQHANLTKFKVAADDALSIAESQGGSSARLRAKNRCGITVMLINWPPAGGYTANHWSVNYGPGYFDLLIDPISGQPSRSN